MNEHCEHWFEGSDECHRCGHFPMTERLAWIVGLAPKPAMPACVETDQPCPDRVTLTRAIVTDDGRRDHAVTGIGIDYGEDIDWDTVRLVRPEERGTMAKCMVCLTEQHIERSEGIEPAPLVHWLACGHFVAYYAPAQEPA